MESLTKPLSTFKEQFTFTPSIVNEDALGAYTKIIVCGMGGSAISVSLLKLLFPEIPLSLHNSYGLPSQYDKASTLLIINSYSGDTEEALDAFDRAKKDGAMVACLSKGGQLLIHAEETDIPYITLPESSLEPRFSIGHQIIGLLTLMKEHDKIATLQSKLIHLNLTKAEAHGKILAETFAHRFPILYASNNLYPVAYLIKAAINEGAKVPSFVNQIPEANHNELQSFITDDIVSSSEAFGLLFLSSPYDHVRIQKRFSVMETMYQERSFTTSTLHADHTDILDIFTLILTGYYMATYMAIAKNINPYTTPFIAEFKKRMAQ